ncbi:hypothetical protein PMI04_003965 [Sphingobium sp. AP49]|uniref:hypothetical protein n=1 Tax=Sphingobium sp. AP49 TaxID=1144307 RepID=UPI00026EE7B1|nr:hypothetical protein [Sphingobium sp. AP49]WHO39756.1 hypothetical protein PMI04_003965 [Sphingobium sp. AP49]
MTTISNYSMTMPPSPRMSMNNRIDAAVETGSISQTDGDALETALDSIDSALGASASSGSSRLDPSAMKDRIDSLIDDQVSAGTLTEDQAAQLQSLFAQGPGGPKASADGGDSMGIDGLSAMDGMQGPQGMRGPPPPRPTEDSGDDDDSTTSETSATSATDQLDSIIAFLENLRSSLSQSLYGSTSSATSSSNSGLVVDSLA